MLLRNISAKISSLGQKSTQDLGFNAPDLPADLVVPAPVNAGEVRWGEVRCVLLSVCVRRVWDIVLRGILVLACWR